MKSRLCSVSTEKGLGAILCEKMTAWDRSLQNKIHSDTIAYLFRVALIRTYENHRR